MSTTKIYPGELATPAQLMELATEYQKAAEMLLTLGRRQQPLSRAPSRTVQGLLPLDGVDRDRLDFHEDLGWPSNPLLKDRDAFGVSQITNRRDGSSYWTPLFWKSARTAIPLGDRANGYRTKSAAVEALQGAAEEYLAVRAGIPIERVAERARLQLDDRALG